MMAIRGVLSFYNGQTKAEGYLGWDRDKVGDSTGVKWPLEGLLEIVGAFLSKVGGMEVRSKKRGRKHVAIALI